MIGTEASCMGDGPDGYITHLGLDVHKATACVALAQRGSGSEIRQIAVFENRPEILIKLAARLPGLSGRAFRGVEIGFAVKPVLLPPRSHRCASTGAWIRPLGSGGTPGLWRRKLRRRICVASMPPMPYLRQRSPRPKSSRDGHAIECL